jgi:alanyl-tRNA synthetase
MNSSEIRSAFLKFFQEKSHHFVASSPIINRNDPSLMFTNAGMNQFKDYFLGDEQAQITRVVNSQKCLRVSGKHNDLEEVGLDTYHHTMFEMLGNWSFGDYFKKEAINWAWELLTEVYKLPAERMYASIFEGDEADNIPHDEEAFDYWKALIPETQIIMGNKKDNFWEMGETGPCGPSSEIHIDLRPEEEVKQVSGRDLVNQDHPLVVEIWNLVFIQFNRLKSGKLEALPAKHIDTGMGFERLVMAIQGKASNYDTDVFQPHIQYVARKSGTTYGKHEEVDIALRVVVDHARATTFAIADGQLPSNNRAGYVIRRILRRAVRYGYTFLNFNTPFLHELVPQLADQFADIFPEIKSQQEFIGRVIREEENAFLKTLDTGLKKIEQLAVKAETSGRLDGAVAFELYDTYGFPYDLTSLIAREKGFTVDEEGFNREMAKQRQRSKQAAEQDTGDWHTVLPDTESTFIGYDYLESTAQIVKYREVKEKKRTYYEVVLDQTPFYAESGGQVGDQGYLEYNNERYPIFDTQKQNNLIVHHMKKLPANLYASFKTVVAANRRSLTANNHTATHLMHAALRKVLGDHVQQKGSLVNGELLRFDFSHYAKLTEEEILEVERLVNEKVRKNIPLEEIRNFPINEAKAMGATALFGEKYGDFVRVIAFDRNYSVELCGGTHVPHTGNIGFFKIVSESSISAGVRRIEAITASKAERFIEEQEQTLKELKELLKSSDLLKSVEQLQKENLKLNKTVEQMQQQEANKLRQTLKEQVVPKDDLNLLFSRVEVPSADVLKNLAFSLRKEVDNLFMVLAANVEGKPQIVVAIDESLAESKGLNAGKLVSNLAKHIKGGGGGQPFYATAGGKDISGLDKVLAEAKNLI